MQIKDKNLLDMYQGSKRTQEEISLSLLPTHHTLSPLVRFTQPFIHSSLAGLFVMLAR